MKNPASALLISLLLLPLFGCQTRPLGPVSGYCPEKILPMSPAERAIYRQYLKLHQGPVSMTASFLPASDGKQVPLSIWRPAGRLRAIVIASPGLDMACSEFSVLGAALAAQGIGVWSLDLRAQGHEQVLSQRGARAPWKFWVRDVRELTVFLKKSHPGVPVFLTGQSTGDCVALLAASQMPPRTYAGLFLHSVPFVYLYPTEKILRDTALFRPVPSPFRISTAYSLSISPYSFADSADPHVHAWLSSPLRVGMTGRYISDCFALGAAAKKSLPIITSPILVQLGCKDSLALSTDHPFTAAARF